MRSGYKALTGTIQIKEITWRPTLRCENSNITLNRLYMILWAKVILFMTWVSGGLM
jgi:hypothetical protein